MNKKLTALALALGAPAVMLAEGTPAYSTAATEVQTALTTALNTLAPMVTAVVVAGIAIWLIPRAVRMIKHGFASGTGR